MFEHGLATPSAPQRVVIIGAGGFVGGAILERIKRDGTNAVGLTRKEVDLLASDAAQKLSGQLKPGDSVVFVSALAPARNVSLLMQNLRMMEAACEVLAKASPTHVIYISSDAVYADDANPVTERSHSQPSSMHGMMHVAREMVLKTAVSGPLAILRPSLIYGARDPHNGYGPNRFRRLAEKRETITLFGEGEERRDHVFVDDVAEIASLTLAHRSRGVLNIATGVSSSFREVAELVVELGKQPVEIKGSPRQNPATHRHFDIADCLKAFPKFHYTPLRQGLALSSTENPRAAR